MPKPSDLLASFKSLSDEDIAAFFALDPELVKRVQKGVLEAKRKEADEIKRQNEESAAASGRVFDAKAWAKAKKLITGPYNKANELDFKTLISKTDPNTAPPGEPSLMAASMDYLAARDRVALDWPFLVFRSGADMGYPEIESLCKLVVKRGMSDLGDNARFLFMETFGLPSAWAEHEAKLKAVGNVLGPTMPLLEFVHKHIFSSNYGAAACSSDARAWAAIENLTRSGCEPLSSMVDNSNYSHRGCLSWEHIVGQAAGNDEACRAKISAFSSMIALGWCDKGLTPLTDNLQTQNSTGSNKFPNCGSRSAVEHLPLELGSLDIYCMLCERETEKGFLRYDEVGRSRLYFINERLRSTSRNGVCNANSILMAMAQKAMDLGDPPESLNAQNPISKAADKHFADMIRSAIEKRDLAGVSGASVASKHKARSL